MSSTKSWRPLPLSPSPNLPVLLVSMDTQPAAYTIHITDMANVWTESLDRKAICIRGWGENTSIDPSDTSDNMTKFLTSIRSALDASDPDHDQTHLRLVGASSSEAGEDGLTLHITCNLPGLEPLKWPMHLVKSPSSVIATDLVLPLIQAHRTRHQEVNSLISILGQKDLIINKLLDKLDAMGTGLEHVFNPLSGKKKVSRVAAADKVPGLEPFSRGRWQLTAADSNDGPKHTESLIKEVFGSEGLRFESTLDISGAPKLDQWWHEFTSASSSQRPSQTKSSELRGKTPLNPGVSMDVDEDDDFQVQSTPPHLASRKPIVPKSTSLPDDASTADEDEIPPQIKNNRIVPTETQKAEIKKPGIRLGALGRKKQSPPARPPSLVPSPPKSRAVNQKVDDSETASDPDDGGGETASEAEDQPPSSPPPPAPKPAAKKSGFGLGRIGGHKPKEPVQEPAQTPDAEIGENSEPLPSRMAPRKLGTIGKKKGNEAVPVASPVPDGRGRSRAPATKDGEPQPRERETSLERADRRREELKRELERKAAAGPAKKKRKF